MNHVIHCKTSSFVSRCKFFSLTETPEDYTLIVDEEGFKGGFCSLYLWIFKVTVETMIRPQEKNCSLVIFSNDSYLDWLLMFDHILRHQFSPLCHYGLTEAKLSLTWLCG